MSPWKYDDLLVICHEEDSSFIGPLYKNFKQKGIHAFLDDYGLYDPNKTMEYPRILVVIISRNFTSSALCLRQVVKIFRPRRIKDVLAIPIFYNVNPKELRKMQLSNHEVLDIKEGDEWKNALSIAKYIPGWVHNDKTNGYESFDKITKELYRMLNGDEWREVFTIAPTVRYHSDMTNGYDSFDRISKRPKSLVASPKYWSYFKKRPFVAFWDMENCNIPAKGAKVSPEEAVNNIKAYVNCKFGIDKKNICIFAYANFSEMRKVIKGLKKTDVGLVNTGKIKDKKDVADKILIYALGMHAVRYPEPYSIMLISGDVDYVKPLQDLHDTWGHNIVLAIPSGSWVSFALTDTSDFLLYWPNVVRGKDQPTLRLEITKDFEIKKGLEIEKGKMLLVEQKPSTKLVEEKPSDKLIEEREEIPNVQVSVESQLQLLSLDDATLIQPGGLTDVVRGEDQPTSSLQIKKGKMLQVEAKPSEKLIEEREEIPNVQVSVDSQLQLLSLNDATPIQSVDLTGLKGELVKFLENSSGKHVNLTRLKGELVEFLGDPSGNRTLLALIRNIGS